MQLSYIAAPLESLRADVTGAVQLLQGFRMIAIQWPPENASQAASWLAMVPGCDRQCMCSSSWQFVVFQKAKTLAHGGMC